VLVVAIAGALPDLVPGAMCGSGVLEAMGGRGERALALRCLALLLLGVWRMCARLDAEAPHAPLRPTVARLLLLALPVALLAALDTWRAIAALDVHAAVDCCAVVYDQLRAAGSTVAAPVGPATWVFASLLAAGLVLLAALAVLRCCGERSPLRTGLLAFAALGFAPVAVLSLPRVWAAYHYGVLAHHCPWCLFRGAHGMVGYPLFFAIALVLFAGPAGFFAVLVGRRRPELAGVAAVRARAAAWRVLVGLLLFAALAFGPALLWRWRHGVWLHG
jgi:hypothetical protein